MKKPTLNFKNLDAAQLLQFAAEIHNKMTENSDIFASPTPDLATLSAATTAYGDAVTEAAFGDRRAISFRNDKREELKTIISDLAKYVDITARGNQTIILSAGFRPTKERSEEHTSELQSRENLVCRLLLEMYCDHLRLPSFPTRRSSDLTTAYGDAVTEAAFGDRRAISFRNDKREELKTIISDLAKYVDITARGNQTIILSAGFRPTKE